MKKTPPVEAIPCCEPDEIYEVIGSHFRNNPHELEVDMLVKHGEPRCKIKRSDFGLKWN